MPTLTTWVPVVDRVDKRPRAKRNGRLALRLLCAPKVPGGLAPPVCTGQLFITAKLGGKQRVVAKRTFTLPVGAEKLVRPKLNRRARARLPLKATLTAVIGSDVQSRPIRVKAPR